MTTKASDVQEPTKSGDENTTPSTQQDEGVAEKLYGKEKDSSEDSKDSEDDSDDTDKENDKSDSKEDDDDGADDKDTKDSDSDEDDDKSDEEDDSEDGATEKYELKRKKDSLLNDDQLEEIEAYAKQQGFSNDQAQALLEREEKLLSGYKKTIENDFEKQVEQWLDDVKNDKEIGGDNFDKNIKTAEQMLKQYSTKEFRKALSESGFGNHPELVRTFVRISEAMTEDTFEGNSNSQSAKPSMADKFYGN